MTLIKIFSKHTLNTFFFILIFIFLNSCTENAPSILKRSIIIDADTANEVDDLYAITRALLEPKWNVLGLTSAQFHISPLASDTSMLESYQLNKQLIEALGDQKTPIFKGAGQALTDSKTPQISPSSDFIIAKAHAHHADHQDEKLDVIILGSCTNVASAILQDPDIIDKISVHYIGFWHDTLTNSYDKIEFNSGNDTLAVNVLLNTKGLDLQVMTATTCQHLVFDKEVVDQHLSGKEGVGELLLHRWNTYKRWWTKEDPEQRKWIMWDLAIVEALIHPELSTTKQFMTPPENTERMITIHTSIDKNKMEADFWEVVDRHLSE